MGGHRFVLFGTGDWGEWADPIFTDLRARGGHAVVVAAGQVENGPEAIDWYRAGARERLERVGIPAIDAPLLSRRDADDPMALSCLDDAAFVYVLGGGPRSTVEALSGSRFWHEITSRRLPYVGSSGGAMLLGAWYPNSVDFAETSPALALFPRTVIAGHWNELDDMAGGLRDAFVLHSRGSILIGLDRDAGLLGDGYSWDAVGEGQVHVILGDRHAVYSTGDRIELALLEWWA